MTDGELRRLRKAELVRLLFRQSRAMERQRDEIQSLRDALQEARDMRRGLAGRGQGKKDASCSAHLGGTYPKDPADEMEVLCDLPDAAQLRRVGRWLLYRQRALRVFRNLLFSFATLALLSLLLAVLSLPVMQIYGSSMEPTLRAGEVVLLAEGEAVGAGDIVAFPHGGRILIKRVIARSGQWVSIAEDGTAYVDQVILEEPYLSGKALGACDIRFPYQVPESLVFVLGDNRSVSIDSRSGAVGCVGEDQIIGKVVFRIWPITAFGTV